MVCEVQGLMMARLLRMTCLAKLHVRSSALFPSA